MEDQKKFSKMDSPTSKPFFLSSMLRMSRDHRIVGLRWLSPLGGVSFGGHGGFLDPFSSSFIFFLISCHIWGCGRRSWDGVYRDQWTMVRTKLLLQWWSLEIRCSPWKRTLLYFALSSMMKRGREKRISRGFLFPSLFRIFLESSPSPFWIVLVYSTLW